MSDTADSVAIADLEQRLKKLRRRQKRNERAAWANGFLTGICGMLRPGDLAIDCGANAGEVSARLLAGGADVVAFDPEPWAQQQLTQRFADQPRFSLHPVAVGVAAGTVRLMRASNFDQNAAQASVKSTVIAGGRQIDESVENTVEVAQIDFIAFLREAIAQRGEIAFLKIDIEGAELDLVPAIDAAGLFDKVRCTVVETHERKFRDRAEDFRAMRDRIAQRYAPSHVSLDWI